MHLPHPLRAEFFQPGHLGRQVAGVDIHMHAAMSFAEPLRQQPRFSAGKCAAVVLGVLVEPGQRLAGGCLPERQFPPVVPGLHVDDDGPACCSASRRTTYATFCVQVVTRREHPAAPIGQYGWDGGLGTIWRNDPSEQMITILLTNAAWTSPRPPSLALDFLTGAYAAIND